MGNRRQRFNLAELERAIEDWQMKRPDGENSLVNLHEELRRASKSERDAQKSRTLDWFKDARQQGLASPINLRRLEDFFGLATKGLELPSKIEAPGRAPVDAVPLTRADRPNVPDSQREAPPWEHLLAKWRQEVLTHARWRPAQPVFGEAAAEQGKALYQELALKPLDASASAALVRGGEAAELRGMTAVEDILSAIAARSLLTALESRSIVVGAPGAGKTALAKWLVQLVERREISDFRHAAYVSLREFAVDIETHPGRGFVEHFLGKIAGAARTLARHADGSASLPRKLLSSVLFVLDGWDEVPVRLRESIRDRIDEELDGLRMVIMSRPSGYPSTLATSDSRSYEIVPLTMSAIRDCVTAYCGALGRPRAAASILATIAREPGLQSVVTSPFLLMALCEVLLRHETLPAHTKLTPSWIVQALIEMTVAQNNSLRPGKVLGAAHMRCLEAFACDLSVGRREKRLSGEAPEEILKVGAIRGSRFLNELSLTPDHFEFTHLRLQEFLAARRLVATPDELRRFCARRLLSVQYAEEAGFIAGLRRDALADEEPWTSLQHALASAEAEKTGQVLQRIGAVVAAAALPDGGLALLGRDMREALLRQVVENRAPTDDTMAILMRMDASYVIRRMLEMQVSDELWERVYRHIPLHVREHSGLEAWVADHPPLQWVQAIPGFGLLDPVALQAQRDRVSDPRTERRERLHAIRKLGMASDHEAIDLLSEYVNRPSILHKNASFALASIGGARAASVLADALIGGNPELSHDEWHTLAESLQIGRHSAIEPASRDKLVAWMRKQQAPRPPVLRHVLHALLRARIPRGGDFVVSLIATDDLEPELLSAAVPLLRGVVEERPLVRALAFALGCDRDELRDAVLGALPHVPVFGGQVGDVLRLSECSDVAMQLLVRTAVRFPNALRHVDLAGRLFHRLSVARESREISKVVELLRTMANLSGDVFDAAAEAIAFDRSATLPERSAAFAYFSKPTRLLNPSFVQAMVVSAMDAHPAARTALMRDVVPLVAGRRPQLVPWLLRQLDGASLKQGSAMAEQMVSRVLRETARQGWLVFDDTVVDPSGEEHSADL